MEKEIPSRVMSKIRRRRNRTLVPIASADIIGGKKFLIVDYIPRNNENSTCTKCDDMLTTDAGGESWSGDDERAVAAIHAASSVDCASTRNSPRGFHGLKGERRSDIGRETLSGFVHE